MDDKPDPPGLKAILASLGQELGRPLNCSRGRFNAN